MNFSIFHLSTKVAIEHRVKIKCLHHSSTVKTYYLVKAFIDSTTTGIAYIIELYHILLGLTNHCNLHLGCRQIFKCLLYKMHGYTGYMTVKKKPYLLPFSFTVRWLCQSSNRGLYRLHYLILAARSFARIKQ